jgi:hypothetical protein
MRRHVEPHQHLGRITLRHLILEHPACLHHHSIKKRHRQRRLIAVQDKSPGCNEKMFIAVRLRKRLIVTHSETHIIAHNHRSHMPR